MLFPVEQAFVGRDEKRAPLKMSAWEARSFMPANWIFMHNCITYSMSSRGGIITLRIYKISPALLPDLGWGGEKDDLSD